GEPPAQPRRHDALARVGRRPRDQEPPHRRLPLTPAAATVTPAERRTALLTSPASGARPSPISGRLSTRPPYRFTPPSRTPSAPAKAASQRPALGLGCRAPSRRRTRHASRPEQSTTSPPVIRAGAQLATSSSRAAAHPNRSYLGLRYPTIASSVLTARYIISPGIPATAPQNSGATDASDVFSATDSTTARASPSASSPRGSRAHRCGSLSLAASRSPRSRARAISSPSRPSDVPPSTAQVTPAVTSACPSRPRATRSRATPAATAPPTRTPAYTTPRHRESAYRPRSTLEATRPNPATGCHRRGSPSSASSTTPRT